MTVTPGALAWSTDNCTVGRAMEVLGERWTFVVLREVFNGVRRFDDMRRHSGIPRQVLTNRLALLVDAGILRRELYPVLVAVRHWGDRYLADPEGSPVEFEHVGCGAEVDVVLRCREGHEVTGRRDVATRPGPGVRPFVA